GICIDPAALELPEHHQYQLHKFDPEKPELGVLPLESTAAPFVDCEDFTALSATAAPWYLRLASAGWNGLVRPIGSFLTPDPLRAINLGFGGLAGSFSRIGWARALTMTVVAGQDQTGPAGSTLPVQPTVMVTADHYDFQQFDAPPPVAGVPVTFTFSDPAGNETSTTVTTDGSGVASAQWTLGSGGGVNRLVVSGPVDAQVVMEALAAVDLIVPQELDVGGRHTCVLDEAGRAYCWGRNGGQLGDGTSEDRTRPVPVGGEEFDETFVAISAADHSTCALTEDGRAFCWGSNTTGGLGTGDGVDHLLPTEVAGNLRFSTISVGLLHTCAVTTEGEAYCWGSNQFGQLGTDAAAEICPSNGECSTTPVAVMADVQFRSIRPGIFATCGLSQLSEIYCWGTNTFGVLGLPDAPVNEPILPTAVDGGSYGQVSTGATSTCALTTTGSLECWGTNTFGQLATGDNDDRLSPTPAAAGFAFSVVEMSNGNTILSFACGIASDGSGHCWGSNNIGRLGSQAAMQTCTFGELVGPCANTPVGIALDATLTDISTGRQHACAITNEDQLYCWGSNAAGQFGNGGTTSSSVPIRIDLVLP
ncbi:MAG: hypothetical protein ACRELV_15320, partial [Longimicrobiales bacterium]